MDQRAGVWPVDDGGSSGSSGPAVPEDVEESEVVCAPHVRSLECWWSTGFCDWTCSNSARRAPRCWPTRNQCFRLAICQGCQECPPLPWAPPGPYCSTKGTATSQSSFRFCAWRPAYQSSAQQETSDTPRTQLHQIQVTIQNVAAGRGVTCPDGFASQGSHCRQREKEGLGCF